MVVESKIEEKRKIIDEIYRSYLERDIAYLLRVEKTDAFSNLIRIIASQVGKLVNYSELSSTLGISFQTVRDYLWYSEKTFITRRVTPYFRNVRKEISKSPVYYFIDIGLRNYSLNLFGNLYSPSELGFVFQNFVFNILEESLRYTPAQIHFWRTKDKAEVDFIIEAGKSVVPIEVKFSDLKKPTIGRSMQGFIKKYRPKTGLVVNLALQGEKTINGTVIRFVPFYKLYIIDLF